MTQVDKIQMDKNENQVPEKESKATNFSNNHISEEEHGLDANSREITSSKETIIIPKIIVPCIQILARFTHQTVDEFLTQLVVIRLADVYQEPEQMVYAMKDQKELFKRFKYVFDKNAGGEYDFEGNPKLEKPKKTNNMEEITFTMKIPKPLWKCIKIYSKITNRTRKDLLGTFIVNHLYWMYQNCETIPGYMKDFGEFQEQLRCGINEYYQEEVF